MLTTEILASSELQTLFDGFCGAVMSGELVAKSLVERINICREVAMILTEAHVGVSETYPITWHPELLKSHQEKWLYVQGSISSTKKLFWSGWPILDRNGKPSYPPIARIWLSHGRQFAEEFYEGLKIHISGEAMANSTIFNKMAVFLASNSATWPPQTFTDPVKIHMFFIALCKSYFKGISESDKNLPVRKKAWNRFIARVKKYYITPGTWATPFRELPTAPKPNMRGHQSHVKETPDGTIIKEKLITDIPLHICNSEAIQLLFFKISNDLNIVRSWSDRQRLIMMSNYKTRKAKAANGTPLDTDKRKYSSDITIENICATFEQYTYDTDLSSLLRRYNDIHNTNITLREFGQSFSIPTTLSLYPFQCGLILEHPQITRSFLVKFKLYDKHGHPTGFYEEDGAYHLSLEDNVKFISGIKARRGAKNARQTFALTAKAAKMIEQLIELTTQARAYLRAKGDDNWRLLFLGSESGACYPSKCGIPNWNSSGGNVLIQEAMEQFSPHTPLRDEALKSFLFRINPGTIRASRVIEDYIETADANLASELLGHKKSRTELLECYLPAPIVAYVETRGVRIIQKAIICHALADSAYLLSATRFDSLDILTVFFKNHVNLDIPAQLSDPDGDDEKDLSDREQEIILKIGVGTLSTLLSLAMAVKACDEPSKINPEILYWSRLSDLLVKEIGFMHDPLLKNHLANAQAVADPSRVMRLIYATP
jgi:hypothetical protein